MWQSWVGRRQSPRHFLPESVGPLQTHHPALGLSNPADCIKAVAGGLPGHDVEPPTGGDRGDPARFFRLPVGIQGKTVAVAVGATASIAPAGLFGELGATAKARSTLAMAVAKGHAPLRAGIAQLSQHAAFGIGGEKASRAAV